MAQQTPVEWLWRWQMDNPFASFKEGVVAYKQAKEMEKEKIKDAYSNGYKNAFNSMAGKETITDEQYYKETYDK
jgi:hypothetical protein